MDYEVKKQNNIFSYFKEQKYFGRKRKTYISCTSIILSRFLCSQFPVSPGEWSPLSGCRQGL